MALFDIFKSLNILEGQPLHYIAPIFFICIPIFILSYIRLSTITENAIYIEKKNHVSMISILYILGGLISIPLILLIGEQSSNLLIQKYAQGEEYGKFVYLEIFIVVIVAFLGFLFYSQRTKYTVRPKQYNETFIRRMTNMKEDSFISRILFFFEGNSLKEDKSLFVAMLFNFTPELLMIIYNIVIVIMALITPKAALLEQKPVWGLLLIFTFHLVIQGAIAILTGIIIFIAQFRSDHINTYDLLADRLNKTIRKQNIRNFISFTLILALLASSGFFLLYKVYPVTKIQNLETENIDSYYSSSGKKTLISIQPRKLDFVKAKNEHGYAEYTLKQGKKNLLVYIDHEEPEKLANRRKLVGELTKEFNITKKDTYETVLLTPNNQAMYTQIVIGTTIAIFAFFWVISLKNAVAPHKSRRFKRMLRNYPHLLDAIKSADTDIKNRDMLLREDFFLVTNNFLVYEEDLPYQIAYLEDAKGVTFIPEQETLVLDIKRDKDNPVFKNIPTNFSHANIDIYNAVNRAILKLQTEDEIEALETDDSQPALLRKDEEVEDKEVKDKDVKDKEEIELEEEHKEDIESKDTDIENEDITKEESQKEESDSQEKELEDSATDEAEETEIEDEEIEDDLENSETES